VSNALFPASDARIHWQNDVTTRLAQAEQRVASGAVCPVFDIDAFKTELARFEFAAPVALDALLDWTIAQLEGGVVHMNHPRYFGLFNPAPSFPAQIADRIVASFNPQLATATTSPAAVEIEAHVIRAVARRAEMAAESVGHFTSGGSEANYTAVICALTQSNRDFAKLGSRAFSGQPVFYISEDSHLAWIKIAHQAGIGRAAARLVPTDKTGRMSVGALESALRADRKAGDQPFMVVATAGTTNAGMVDPLLACAEVARHHELWYHVDAAWGGGAIASGRLRGLLAGIGRADSVTIDAHKWFATTMGCGMFLTAHPSVLSDTFNVTTSFMPSHTPSLDPYVTTAQWSRRFLGLRLFLALGAGGWAGYGAHVDRAVELGKFMADRLMQNGWRVLNEPELAVVCALPPEGSAPVREVARRVVASGGAWVSAARLAGQDVLRACITNGETTEADVAALVEMLVTHSVI